MSSRPIRSLALVTNGAFSIANFRGPLVRAMIARGVTVHALAPDFDEETRAAVTALGAVPVDISLDRAGLKPLRDLADLIRLYRVMRRLRPDATLSYFIKPVIYGTIAAAAAGVRHRFALVAGLGYLFHDDPEHPPKKRVRAIARLLYRIAFSLCERVFFQNEEDKAEFVDTGLLPAAKAVRLAGTGVDLERLRPVPLVHSPPTFLLMARLLKQKGIREYAAAARIVKASHPEARFILLGGVDPNPDCVDPAEVEGWVEEGVLEWPGHTSDVTPWIAQSSVYVLPSNYREGMPRSTQEAMAMGRAVITTDNIGCRETVIDGVTGFLIPVRDAEALAAAMLRFIEAPELIETMGRESRRLAEQRFDTDRINETFLACMGIGPAAQA